MKRTISTREEARHPLPSACRGRVSHRFRTLVLFALSMPLAACGSSDSESLPDVSPFQGLASRVSFGDRAGDIQETLDVYSDGSGALRQLSQSRVLTFSFDARIDSGPPPANARLVSVTAESIVPDTSDLRALWESRVGEYRSFTGATPSCSESGGYRTHLRRASFPGTPGLIVEAEVSPDEGGLSQRAVLRSIARNSLTPPPGPPPAESSCPGRG